MAYDEIFKFLFENLLFKKFLTNRLLRDTLFFFIFPGGKTLSPETNKRDSVSQQEGGVPATSTGMKWPCLACTYENWPRAATCVICHARRGRTSPDHQQALAAAATSVSSRDSPSPEGASMQRLPVDSFIQARRSQQQLEAAAAAAAGGLAENSRNSSSSCHSGASSAGLITASLASPGGGSGAGSPSGESTNNLQYEKRLRQLRRRMRETDWAWVSACMGVVEGDACPVEAYLNSGGDPTRKLTAAECSLLARPGVYEQGHTLVHLAVKLHRWVESLHVIRCITI